MPSNKILLDENEMSKQWYCILPDLPKPIPPMINPETREPVPPQALEAVFAKELVKHEASKERWINIPEEVRDVYRLWRPTPLIRAVRFERALKTPAKIYYKYEGVSPPGSHKPNTAVVQAYYNMKEGIERLTTETGAGQWGSSLAFGCMLFGMESTVYMVRASYFQKPYRKVMMETWGARDTKYLARITKEENNFIFKKWREEICEELDFLTKRKEEVESEMEEFINRVKSM